MFLHLLRGHPSNIYPCTGQESSHVLPHLVLTLPAIIPEGCLQISKSQILCPLLIHPHIHHLLDVFGELGNHVCGFVSGLHGGLCQTYDLLEVLREFRCIGTNRVLPALGRHDLFKHLTLRGFSHFHVVQSKQRFTIHRHTELIKTRYKGVGGIRQVRGVESIFQHLIFNGLDAV